MHNSDYSNAQHPSLFSNRNEDRKTTRFKKNNPTTDQRGYGKPQKYQSQKAGSATPTAGQQQQNGGMTSQVNHPNAAAMKTAHLMNNSNHGNGAASAGMPHSLLEKEIRHIMNQS